ncbi:putative protein kinase [Trypanosoma rangeli]|uniref:Protein kinase domain-containing protein n=1 Tax=Trypanosoma rangeli TaxID=5698 RepID=A0A422NCZ1_TRYRA|nr:putative protein kinase [Trypanosoma rangeli]RNF03374.1 putative protein kinase [Trypanosoma rangeli]|eukprot:RNF03374.1 putative protein kinase [Trypanosoma rangeli]
MRAGAGGDAARERHLRPLLSPRLADAFCSLDVDAVERVLGSAVAALRHGEARRWGEGILESACRSLLCAYVVGLRLAVGSFAPEEDGAEPAWRELLKMTTCTGGAIAEMCAVPGVTAAASAVMQLISGLLRPPSPARQSTPRETRLFWSCYPWWCCLLHHCLTLSASGEGAAAAGTEVAAAGVAARALSWVSRHYASEAGRMAGHSVVDMPIFLSALTPVGRAGACPASPAPAPSGEPEACGCGEDEPAATVPLGQLVDVHGASLVRSFACAARGRRDTDTTEEEGHSRDFCPSPLATQQQRQVSALQRALFVASRLCTPFVMQDLHTLLPLRTRPGTAEQNRGGNDASPPTQSEPHCDVCGLLERQFSSRGTAARRTPVAHALLLLCAVLSRRPPSLSVPLQRCLGEQAAAAALAALLCRDADVADAFLSLLARLGEDAGSIYFVALWRAAFAAAAKEPSETMAWLLAGLARAVEKRRLEGDGCGTHAFLAAVDATFESVVRVMAVLLSAFSAAVGGDAGRRLRDLCARGFVEVWDALLHASPRHGGGAAEGLLCDVMQMDHASQSEPATAQLRGPLEAYYVSVLERWCAMRGECMTAASAASVWWPEAEGRVDAHEHSLLVLQHTLALSEYVSHANCIFQLRHAGARHGRHPAAFFLQGMESLCARLFLTQAESAAQVQVGEIQRVASQILAVTVRTICTRPGRELFAPIFGKSSGRYATTYTSLLYLCFLQKLHQTPNPDKLCLQALLRALRTLIIWESEAYNVALRLSIPLMFSCMLPESAVAGKAAGAEVQPLTTPAKASVQEQRLASTTTPPAVSMKNTLGNNGGGDSSRVVGTAGAAAPARLFMPTLSVAALPPPQYYAWMGEAEETCFAANTNAQAPPLPPLNLTPQSQQPHWDDGVPAVTRSSGEEATRAALDDPATLAEVLLLLCCLLPGRTGGMISQSGLVAAHPHACNQTRGTYVDCMRGNVPFVRVLQKVEEFVRCPANKASLQLFDELVTAEAQEKSALWAGVDVLRRLLSPQLQLLEGITITRRIGAGSYGSVFAAERYSAAAASNQDEMKLGDVSQSLALKMVSIARPHMGDECATLVSCHTEATALLRLQGHAHICELLFVGCTATHYVLAMPLYKGGSLRDWRVLKSGFRVGEPAEESGCGTVTEAASGSTHPSPKGSFLAVCGPIFAQVLAAVEFMHAHGIRHNDIKADNILIESLQGESLCLAAVPQMEEEGEGEDEGMSGVHVGPKGRGVCIPVAIRLCDFGVCELVGEDMFAVRRCNEVAGGAETPCWGPTRGTEAVQAPEALSLASSSAPARRAPYCEAAIPPSAADFPASSAFANVAKELAADMWACGCLLYELLTGVMLFGGANLGRLLFLAANLRSGGCTSHEVLQPHQKRALEMAGPGVAEFVSQLLAVNPAERPTASEARQAWAQVMQAQSVRRMSRDWGEVSHLKYAERYFWSSSAC